jgi:hypothetical protein
LHAASNVAHFRAAFQTPIIFPYAYFQQKLPKFTGRIDDEPFSTHDFGRKERANVSNDCSTCASIDTQE